MAEIVYGWLSPLGEMHECKIYDHTATAEEIIKNYYGLPFPNPNIRYADFYLLENNWVHITTNMRSHKRVIYWKKFLTEYQVNFLKPIIENNRSHIDDTSLRNWDMEVKN